MTLPQTRRGLLRSSAALLLAGGVAASTAPEPPPGDAELLAACALFATAAQEVARLEAIRDTPDEEFEAAVMIAHAAVVQVSGLRARTAAGLRAKAAVCRAVYAADEPVAMVGIFGGKAQRHDVLAWSTLNDVAGVVAAQA